MIRARRVGDRPVETGPVMGRQPSTRTIAPSRSYPWYGTDQPGLPYTCEQEYFADKAGIDLATAEQIVVRREATADEMWWGSGTPPPVFEFACPVLSRRADGKVKLIAPSGENKFVQADGWVRAPRGARRSMFW